MRLFALTALTMIAFAANSVLNRLALEAGDAGPASFAAIRLGSGALMLIALLVWRDRAHLRLRGLTTWQGPAALLVYVLGFSFAYRRWMPGLGR